MLSEGKWGTDDTFGMYVMIIWHMWAVKVQNLKVTLAYLSRFILPNRSYESSLILDWILNSLNLILMSRTMRAQDRTWDKIMSICGFIQSWWCWTGESWGIKSNAESREASLHYTSRCSDVRGLNQGFRLHHRPWILKKYPRHLKAKNINKDLGSVSDPLVLYSRVKVQHTLKATLFPCICKPLREHGHKVMHMMTSNKSLSTPTVMRTHQKYLQGS